MKNDVLRLAKKIALCLVPVLLYALLSYGIDTYNVFHPDHIRITEAESNKNFIKTRYVLKDPDRFNAFVFGSSRIANLPREGLPAQTPEGEALRWYNMTYSMGCPQEHLATMQTLLEGGVEMKMVVMGIDEIAMSKTGNDGPFDPIREPYQDYAENPLRFYYTYLKLKPTWSLLPQVLFGQNSPEAAEARDLFYAYGVDPRNTDMSVPEKDKPLESALGGGAYHPEAGAAACIGEIRAFCEEHDIEFVLFTSPTVQTTYEEAVENGYLQYLEDVRAYADFVDFSGYNAYTTKQRYYFDSSHYRPYVGRQMEAVLFEGAPAWETEHAK